MVRAPCCEKMGLKKGPWTVEEDHVLINYVMKYGHGNWRALPKQAGLLRCGKSCRLRWVNYLRPDIKRGNFSREEEDAIVELHELLGNRWSAIAARLPGRTDNEIKNVWHTHLKKKLKQNHIAKEINRVHQYSDAKSEESEDQVHQAMNTSKKTLRPESPQNSGFTDTSASTTDHDTLRKYFSEDEANLWSEGFLIENSKVTRDQQLQFQFSPVNVQELFGDYNSTMVDDSMDFWFNLLSSSENVTALPEF